MNRFEAARTAPLVTPQTRKYIFKALLRSFLGGYYPQWRSLPIFTTETILWCCPAILYIPFRLISFDTPLKSVIFGASLCVIYWSMSLLCSLAHRRRKIRPISKIIDDEPLDLMKNDHHGFLETLVYGLLVGISGGLFFGSSPSILFTVFGLFALCAASYASTLCYLADANIYQSGSTDWIRRTDTAYRLFYLTFINVYMLLTKDEPEIFGQVGTGLVIALPILWTAGVLPVLDVLGYYIIEQVNVWVFGGSETADFKTLCISLATAIVSCATSLVLLYFTRWSLASVLSASVFGLISGTMTLRTWYIPWKTWIFAALIFGIILGIYLPINYLTKYHIATDCLSIAIAFVCMLIQWRYSKNMKEELASTLSTLVFAVLSSSILIDFTPDTQTIWSRLYVLLVFRASRWVWHRSQWAVTEAFVSLSIRLTLKYATDHAMNPLLALTYLLFYSSFISYRTFDMMERISFIIISAWTATMNKKLFPGIGLIITVYLCIPMSIASAVFCTIIQCPLIPLLGLPIFIPSYPRPKRFWPASSDEGTNSHRDSLFYLHTCQSALFKTQLFERLYSFIPGNNVILRFSNRTIWLQILEKSFSHVMIGVRGLEMQETSCHTLEATRLDDILDREKSMSFLNVVKPFGKFSIPVYSDSKVNLIGILDHPDTLGLIALAFYKAIVWKLSREDQSRMIYDLIPGKPSDFALKKFPGSWFQYLQKKQAINESVVLIAAHFFAAIFPSEIDIARMNCSQVVRYFSGSFFGIPNEFLTHRCWPFVIDALRTGIRIAIDHQTVGEIKSFEELEDMLLEYDRDWFFGNEGTDIWNSFILSGKPALFSVSFDEGKPRARCISIQPTTIRLASVNDAAVEGIWAQLQLELLYMTNDDDERYSIQANENILRNMTVQAAKSPLGYSIYEKTLFLT